MQKENDTVEKPHVNFLTVCQKVKAWFFPVISVARPEGSQGKTCNASGVFWVYPGSSPECFYRENGLDWKLLFTKKPELAVFKTARFPFWPTYLIWSKSLQWWCQAHPKTIIRFKWLETTHWLSYAPLSLHCTYSTCLSSPRFWSFSTKKNCKQYKKIL